MPSHFSHERARVLAADDQPAFREAVREVVEATDGLVVVGEAESGEEAIELAAELIPDLVLLDVRMPGIGGVEAARAIKAARPGAVVVLLSAIRPEELRYEAGSCPADAVVWKHDLRPGLLERLWERYRSVGEPGTAFVL